MSRSGQGPKQRLKTAKGRKVSSTRWLERQLNDPYVKRAKALEAMYGDADHHRELIVRRVAG